MNCAALLANVSDKLCVEEFLAALPGPVRASLAGALTVLNTISQAEAFLSTESDKLLDKGVDLVDEKLAAALMPIQPLFNMIDQVAPAVGRFATCPTVGTMVTGVLAPVVNFQSAIRSATWRKARMKEAAVMGASVVTRGVLEAASAIAPTGATAKEAQDVLDGISDCLGAVGPSFLPL